MNGSFVILFAASLAFSTICIYVLIKSPLAARFADKPDLRKVHQQIVPRIGGVGLIFAFLTVGAAGIVIFGGRSFPLPLSLQLCFVFIALFILFLGGIDDIRRLNYKSKFALQFLLASSVVWGFDLKFESLYALDQHIYLGTPGDVLSVFWLVGVMNAFNIIDGVDGLASIVGIIAFTTLAILFNAGGSVGFVLLCVVLAGSTTGFLIHNFKGENKTFLGDTGSLFLGAMVGALCLALTALPGGHFSVFVPLLVVGYPVFDISVAMVRRYRCKGFMKRMGWKERFLKMFIADNEHLHHRLIQFGMSHVQTTFLLSMVAATMGSMAIITSRNGLWIQGVIFAYLGAAMTLILNRLGYLGRNSWLTFPRSKSKPLFNVGVIQSDDVFYHSLKNFQQFKFKFSHTQSSLQNSGEKEFDAYIVHINILESFEESWKNALRLAEVKECPIFVIAERAQFRSVRPPPSGFKTVIPIYKPARIPEMISLMSKRLSQKSIELALEKEAYSAFKQTHDSVNV